MPPVPHPSLLSCSGPFSPIPVRNENRWGKHFCPVSGIVFLLVVTPQRLRCAAVRARAAIVNSEQIFLTESATAPCQALCHSGWSAWEIIASPQAPAERAC